MGLLAGTVLANPIPRQLGCRIGKRTLLTEPLQAFDWNAVTLGDDCVFDGLLQLHSFESMTLRVKRTVIESGSSVDFGLAYTWSKAMGTSNSYTDFINPICSRCADYRRLAFDPAYRFLGDARCRCPQ